MTGQESEEVDTHQFSLDGVSYAIDLTPENYAKLAEALNPFIAVARKQARSQSARQRRASGNSSEDTAAIRAWAKENGRDINDRGRVPAAIREAYEQAN